MNPIEITGIKAYPSPNKAGWFLIKQFSKDPITGDEIDLGIACGLPLRKGYKLSKESFVVVYREYSLDEKIISQLKSISKHIKLLKNAEKEVMSEYIAEVSKGISNADISALATIQSKYKDIIEEIETAVFFSDSLIKLLDSENTKKVK